MAEVCLAAENLTKNPERAALGWPAAVIASAHHTATLLMRDLARRGIAVCCLDWDPSQAGFHTKHGKGYQCPNPDDKPVEWLRFMIELAGRFESKPVLIPSADLYVSAMARHARELENYFLFCHATVGVQAALGSKESLYDLAAKHGMPVPRTHYVTSACEAQQFAETARYPCLLKPLHCREWERPLPDGHPLRWQKLVTAASAQELMESYHLAAAISPRVVLQEMIAGPDTAKVVYLSCYSQRGERIASCIFRELRTGPIDFGCASVVEPVVDPETDELCDGFLRRLGYTGLCEIELKRDSRDGRMQMIEANPRYSGTADAAPYAGVPLGWLHYLDLIGRNVSYVGPNGRDFRHVAFLRDLFAINSYRRAGLETWRSLLWSYRPPLAFYDVDLRDWRMTGRTLKTLALKSLSSIYRSVFPKRPARPQ
jgi:D-aspartate ligase